MKNILFHVHDDGGHGERLEVALDLARQTGGELHCVAGLGLAAPGRGGDGQVFGPRTVIGDATLIDRADDAGMVLRQETEQRLLAAGVPWRWHSHNGNAVEALAETATFADVIVLGQRAGCGHDGQPHVVVSDVVMRVRCPVLMVPHGVRAIDLAQPMVVAWNGSIEAAQALRLALPVLQAACAVHLVEVADELTGHEADEAKQWLARHGIRADIHEWPAKGRRTSVALLHAVVELAAGCLVMGAYGHSRRRETTIGGVTRELIAGANIPLLMAH